MADILDHRIQRREILKSRSQNKREKITEFHKLL